MIVLVRWCYNVDCHSVGRVPSSYPRGVRLPTAFTLILPYAFPFCFLILLFVLVLSVLVFLLLGRYRCRLCLFCLCSFPPFGYVFVFPHRSCACIVLRCFVSFSFLLSVFPSYLSLSFLFPLAWCASFGSLCLCSTRSSLPCRFTCVLLLPSSACSCLSSVAFLSFPVFCLLSVSVTRFPTCMRVCTVVSGTELRDSSVIIYSLNEQRASEPTPTRTTYILSIHVRSMQLCMHDVLCSASSNKRASWLPVQLQQVAHDCWY